MATINDVLTEVDELKPNQYDDWLKIKWLSNLELRVVNEVFNTHEDTQVVFDGFTDADIDTELLVPEPYSELYKYYLFSMIDFNNQETDRYVNSTTMFNASYRDFVDYFNRTHKPLSKPLKLF